MGGLVGAELGKDVGVRVIGTHECVASPKLSVLRRQKYPDKQPQV